MWVNPPGILNGGNAHSSTITIRNRSMKVKPKKSESARQRKPGGAKRIEGELESRRNNKTTKGSQATRGNSKAQK